MSTLPARKPDPLPGQMRRYADWRQDRVLDEKRRAILRSGMTDVAAMLRGDGALAAPDPHIQRLQDQRQRLLQKIGFGQLPPNRLHITETRTYCGPGERWRMTGALESLIYPKVGRAAIIRVEQRIKALNDARKATVVVEAAAAPIPPSRALVVVNG